MDCDYRYIRLACVRVFRLGYVRPDFQFADVLRRQYSVLVYVRKLAALYDLPGNLAFADVALELHL